jgi:hypothetical protein
MTSHLQLLSLPLELRYHLFRTIIYTSHVINIGHGVSDNRKTQENGKVNVSTSGRLKNHLVDLNPESGGPFEALSLTCTQLRNEIAEWFRIEQNMCKDLFLTKAFGFIHRENTLFGFKFSFSHDGHFGEEILTSSVRRLHILTELFGLWRDVTIRAKTNNLGELDERIKIRLRDRGWREQACLKTVWDFRQRFSEKKEEMVPNLEWEYWSILSPDILMFEKADEIQSWVLDVMV